jgi:Ca2+-binding EF-hand superfamily protein
MNMGLDEEEIITLFKAMDMNNDGVISYDELVNMF